MSPSARAVFEGQSISIPKARVIDERGSTNMRAASVGPSAASVVGCPSRLGLGNQDALAALRWDSHRRADDDRRRARRGVVPGLCRAGFWRRRFLLAKRCCWTMCQRTRSPVRGKPIEAKGASVIYLPPYSPDFNPIEKPFSKIKYDPSAHRSAHGRSPGGGSRRAVAELHTARVHELLCLIRLRCSLIG